MRWRADVVAASLLPALALAGVAYERRWISDDGLINVRVVEQLLAGNGPVLNAGERVEVATSPLWVFLLAVGQFLWQTDIEFVALAFGIVLTAGGLVAASAAAAVTGRTSRPHVWLPAGAVAYAALPPAWDFATSGLDTSLSLAWMGTVALLLALTDFQRLRSQAYGAAVLIGLGPLVRPDLVVMSAVFLAALLLLCRKPSLLPAALAVPVVCQVVRMGYYGVVIPNTAIAKEAGKLRPDQGLLYLGDLFGNYELAVPTAAAAVALLAVALRRASRLPPLLAPALAGLAHGAYIVLVGGDFMSGRLLLPSVFALLSPVMVVAARLPARRPALGAAWFVLPVVAMAAWAAVCAASMRPPYGRSVNAAGIIDERAYYVWLTGHEDPITRYHYDHLEGGQWAQAVSERAEAGRRDVCVFIQMEDCVQPVPPLDARWQADAAMSAYVIGAPSALADVDVHIIDTAGLGDPVTARQVLHRRGRPGHEKAAQLEWVVAKFGAPDAPPPRDLNAAHIAGARRALTTCGRFVDLEEATTERLTPGRFVRNVLGAFGRTFWRFDQSDPPRC